MDYLDKARRVLDIEIVELQRLRERLDENFSRAVTLIKEGLEARGKVVVLGVGKSGHIGRKIASTLTSTGSPAVVLDSLAPPAIASLESAVTSACSTPKPRPSRLATLSKASPAASSSVAPSKVKRKAS